MSKFKSLFGDLKRPCLRVACFAAGLLGLAAFIAAKIAAPQWQEFLLGIGSLLIGIAVTVWLTIAQKAHADRASRIVDRCDQAGIETIFASRRTDATALEAALLAECAKSQNIWLLGVAFRSLFDPSEEYTLAFRESLYDPAKSLRVLILDPDCDAANERKEIERGNATIDHINTPSQTGSSRASSADSGISREGRRNSTSQSLIAPPES